MAQIVWLNGAFGAGKTITANELVKLLPGARTFDLEKHRWFMPTSVYRWQGR